MKYMYHNGLSDTINNRSSLHCKCPSFRVSLDNQDGPYKHNYYPVEYKPVSLKWTTAVPFSKPRLQSKPRVHQAQFGRSSSSHQPQEPIHRSIAGDQCLLRTALHTDRMARVCRLYTPVGLVTLAGMTNPPPPWFDLTAALPVAVMNELVLGGLAYEGRWFDAKAAIRLR
jgi:hypothetical protein